MTFKSNYSGGTQNPAQRLAEIACERKYKKQGVTLPPKFWNDERYKRDYLNQIRFAHALLKVYEPKTIFEALSRAKYIWSLGSNLLEPFLRAAKRDLEKRELIKEIVKEEPVVLDKTCNKKRPNFVQGKSILDKIKDSEGTV